MSSLKCQYCNGSPVERPLECGSAVCNHCVKEWILNRTYIYKAADNVQIPCIGLQCDHYFSQEDLLRILGKQKLGTINKEASMVKLQPRKVTLRCYFGTCSYITSMNTDLVGEDHYCPHCTVFLKENLWTRSDTQLLKEVSIFMIICAIFTLCTSKICPICESTGFKDKINGYTRCNNCHHDYCDLCLQLFERYHLTLCPLKRYLTGIFSSFFCIIASIKLLPFLGNWAYVIIVFLCILHSLPILVPVVTKTPNCG
ncbi:unnamed protein product [Moneuplotes crassus]|uniref:RING-type domain-containing protein n=1 Tax=Euplotes crassus TaxID=5936 RepID=A0AAD1XAI5_EUPCR|nr:unnamed protein product [Moneuplotes crassus]